jgi:outer membrane lipoprotein-sorting protein
MISKKNHCLLFLLIISSIWLLSTPFSPKNCYADETVDEFLIHRTCHNISKINSYTGIVIQKGIVDKQTVKAEIFFKKPSLYLSKIISPQLFKGISILYKDNLLLYYFPTLNWAIRIKNLPQTTTKQFNTIISEHYYNNINNFDFTFGKATSIANLPVITLVHKSKSDYLWNRSGKTMIYDTYSFPLAGEIHFKGDHRYEYQYLNISFNMDFTDQIFEVPLSRNTIISDWDLNASPLSLTKMRAKANFQFSEPKDYILGLKRDRIIEQNGMVPAFALLYKKDPYFIIITMIRDYGFGTNDIYGIPIQSSKKGRLILSSILSSFSFIHKEVIYTITGNLSFEDIIAIADTIH